MITLLCGRPEAVRALIYCARIPFCAAIPAKPLLSLNSSHFTNDLVTTGPLVPRSYS